VNGSTQGNGIRFNNDSTAAHYAGNIATATNTTWAGADYSTTEGSYTNSNGGDNYHFMGYWIIENETLLSTGCHFYHAVLAIHNGSGVFQRTCDTKGYWLDDEEITRIDLGSWQAGGFRTGSVMTLYGMK